VITSVDYPVGSIIEFNGAVETELKIPMQVRNDDVNEVLKVRWRVDNENIPDFGSRPLDYRCPEEVVPVSGAVIRPDWKQSIPAAKFPTGECSRLEFAVSGSFYDCQDLPLRWDDTPIADDVGHAVYWVWETSTEPLKNAGAAFDLIRSCQTYITHRPVTGTGTTGTGTGK
jgi:hypothetical protein